MRKFWFRRWLFAGLILTPCLASAAGLGGMTVLSALGQPLHAQIDLSAVTKDELGSLSVRLASPDAYKQAGLQYSGSLANLSLGIEKRPTGEPYIKVMSVRPANELIIDLLVDLNWSDGRIMRAYRVTLNPPER
jgi:pilus assembly protein FimV